MWSLTDGLWRQFGRDLQCPLEGDAKEETKSLASKMGGVTIVRKGRVDVISNGSAGDVCV